MRVTDLVRELENPQGHYNAAEVGLLLLIYYHFVFNQLMIVYVKKNIFQSAIQTCNFFPKISTVRIKM